MLPYTLVTACTAASQITPCTQDSGPHRYSAVGFIMRRSLETRIKFCITFVVCLCLRFSRNRRAVEISNIIEI